jgi:hypothetical protein
MRRESHVRFAEGGPRRRTAGKPRPRASARPLHRAPHPGGQGLLRGGPGRLLRPGGGVVDRHLAVGHARDERPGHGDLQPAALGNPDPFGPRHPVQYTSGAFTERAKRSGLLPSMGSIGDCFDNAVVESFWARMQVELLDRRRWRTRVELANAIFEHLEIFHNRQRRHSSLGMLTPIEYERMPHPTAGSGMRSSDRTPRNRGNVIGLG